MDIRTYNRAAWDRQVESGENPWTRPVSPEAVASARRGEWQVLLTENLPVPRDWFPPLPGLDLLALACGGGQQGPIFAAAGANVTVFDNSPRQLEQDRMVAEREGLANLRTVEGDARDLSMFADASFDLVFNPVSTAFIPAVRPIWQECSRVLRPGGTLLTGFMNPDVYIFETEKADQGVLEVVHSLPYAEVDDPQQCEKSVARGWPLEFSHSLSDQIGGQLEAGFHLAGLYEDRHRDYAPARYMPTYLATRAIKHG